MKQNTIISIKLVMLKFSVTWNIFFITDIAHFLSQFRSPSFFNVWSLLLAILHLMPDAQCHLGKYFIAPLVHLFFIYWDPKKGFFQDYEKCRKTENVIGK